MKNSKTLFALATATLLTAKLFASPVTQYLKLEVTDNSNMTVQQVTAVTMSFSSAGSDAFGSNDLGNENSLGSLSEIVYPFCLTDDNHVITMTNSMSELQGYKKIRFGFATKFPATIKIIANTFGDNSDITNRPTYAWIEQISTGYIYPILNDTLKLDVAANLNFESDYYLHTGPKITNQVMDENCYHAYDGGFSVHNPLAYNWNLKVYHNSTVIMNSFVSQPDTTIANMTSGNYSVVTSINSIPVDSSSIFIDGNAQIIPDFSIDNYNPTTTDVVNFTNASSGSVSYSWDFGDGEVDSSYNASHRYLLSGNYAVVLTATNEIGCQETVYDSVFVTTSFETVHQSSHSNSVIGGPNEVTAYSKPFNPSINTPAGTERIMIGQDKEEVLTVKIMDMGGRFINGVTSSDASFEVSVPQAGMYVVQIVSANGEMKSKTVLITN